MKVLHCITTIGEKTIKLFHVDFFCIFHKLGSLGL